MSYAFRSGILPLAIACLLAAGCAQLDRYPGPSVGKSLEQRQEILAHHSLRVDGQGVLYGQGRMQWSAPLYVRQVAPQFLSVTSSAPLGLGWRDLAWVGGIAGALAGMGGLSAKDQSLGVVSVVGLFVLWEGDLIGRKGAAYAQDSRAFNAAMARDLGLDEGWADQFIDLEDFPAESDGGWRAGLGLTTARISALDYQDYFSGPPPLSFRFNDEWSTGLELWLARRAKGGLTPGLELGVVRRRDDGVQWYCAGVPGTIQMVSLAQWYAGLDISQAFEVGRLGRSRVCLSPKAALRWAWLTGQERFYDRGYAQLGQDDFLAMAPSLGLSLRLSLSLLRRADSYVEFGYDHCVFAAPRISGASGSQQGRSGTQLSGDGRDAVWDFSGPVIKAGVILF